MRVLYPKFIYLISNNLFSSSLYLANIEETSITHLARSQGLHSVLDTLLVHLPLHNDRLDTVVGSEIQHASNRRTCSNGRSLNAEAFHHKSVEGNRGRF